MSGLSLLVWTCLLQPSPFAQPPATAPVKETKEVRGVVVEIFPDGTLLVSAGDDDDAEKGDTFTLMRIREQERAPEFVASAEIVSLGKRYSLAHVKVLGPGAKPKVGDRLTGTAWQRAKRELDARMQRGGAIIDKDK